jgi:hypothetical protein
MTALLVSSVRVTRPSLLILLDMIIIILFRGFSHHFPSSIRSSVVFSTLFSYSFTLHNPLWRDVYFFSRINQQIILQYENGTVPGSSWEDTRFWTEWNITWIYSVCSFHENGSMATCFPFPLSYLRKYSTLMLSPSSSLALHFKGISHTKHT